MGQEADLDLREQQVLKHIANRESNKQIARELDLSVRTVETHRLNIKRKLNVDGQAELIKFAVQHAHLGIERPWRHAAGIPLLPI